VPFIFWADHVTTRKSTGYSPFYITHGVDPVLPFNLTLATFLVPDIDEPLSTEDLLAIRTHQLEKRPANFAAIHNHILMSRFASVHQFINQHVHMIRDYDFDPGTLVLVRNSGSNMDKTKPHYYGPMVVLRHNCNGTYRLGELDGAISKLHYAAFRLIPYHARSQSFIPVTRIVDNNNLTTLAHEDSPANDSNNELTREGQILTPQEV